MEAQGVAGPPAVRFFRGQMQTIITRACAEVGMKTIASRRCFTLIDWLDERHAEVYPAMEGYDAAAAPVVSFGEALSPRALPDALRGEQWAFVSLPLSALVEECGGVRAGKVFGDVFDVAELGLAPDALVPGVAVFSRRALALSAWTNGLELSSLKPETNYGLLLLETGISTCWQYATYRVSAETTEEAKEWEAAKAAANGLHFLAVQSDPDSPTVDGFWLLRDVQTK
mmetsp:Transcript_24056/g.78302  ORF Transcript_24056/g.78302 Transcript_24056/m.78302 type:complete len:228 (+) Transcript_24056:1179-1862(+)